MMKTKMKNIAIMLGICLTSNCSTMRMSEINCIILENKNAFCIEDGKEFETNSEGMLCTNPRGYLKLYEKSKK